MAATLGVLFCSVCVDHGMNENLELLPVQTLARPDTSTSWATLFSSEEAYFHRERWLGETPLAKFVAHNLSIFMSIIIIIILYVSSYNFSYLSSCYSNNMCYVIFMTYSLLYFLFI